MTQFFWLLLLREAAKKVLLVMAGPLREGVKGRAIKEKISAATTVYVYPDENPRVCRGISKLGYVSGYVLPAVDQLGLPHS